MSEEKEVKEILEETILSEKVSDDADETISDVAEELIEKIEDKTEELKDEVTELAEDVVKVAEETVDAAEEVAEDVKEQITEAANDVKENIKEDVSKTVEKVKKEAKNVKKATDNSKKKSSKTKSSQSKYVSETKKMWIRIGIIAAAIIIGAVLLVPALNTKSPILTNKTVITVDGVKIPADEYSYYVGSVVDNYAMYYGYDYFENDTNFNSILSYVNQVLKEHYVVYNWALEEGCALTDEEKQEILDQIADMKASYETEEEYRKALEASHLNEELYEKLLMTDKVIDKFSDKIYDPETSKFAPASEDVERLGKENGIIASKHILMLPGETDEEDEEILGKMNELLERIRNGEDFDELMNEYSEDPGLANNPNGYTFMDGEMVDEFYDTTNALEIGGVSDVVRSSSGFHIIKRIEPDREETINRLISIVVNDELEAKLEEKKVKLGSGFDKIQYSDFNLGTETEATDAADDAA